MRLKLLKRLTSLDLRTISGALLWTPETEEDSPRQERVLIFRLY